MTADLFLNWALCSAKSTLVLGEEDEPDLVFMLTYLGSRTIATDLQMEYSNSSLLGSLEDEEKRSHV